MQFKKYFLINNKRKLLVLLYFFVITATLFIGHYGLPEPELPPPELDQSQIIKGAEPFFFEGDKNKAVLLIHGLRGTPQSLKYTGRRLCDKGYTVIIPLLPGHGTNYNDFEKSRFYHWYEKASAKAILYRKKYKNFHIVGLSMGGSITLKLLEDLPEKLLPDSAILISTPVFLNKISFGLVHIDDWRLFLTGIIKFFFKRISDPTPSKEEFEIIPEISYQGFHVPACVHSFKIALSTIDKNLVKVKTPILIMQARGDKTVSDKNLEYIFGKISSDTKEKYFFDLTNDRITKRHTITLHRDTKERIAQKITEFLDRF